ncbi:hypothetical protein SMU66_08978 [Streptococcus mutans N34]|nr:hypothetical protein SMU66_08978 [Streptococcus mutans N34]QFG42346.1 hypothetical protein FSA31_1585 [Streptococcus mutans]
MYIHNIISVKGVQAVLLEQDRIQLKKWENSNAFRTTEAFEVLEI